MDFGRGAQPPVKLHPILHIGVGEIACIIYSTIRCYQSSRGAHSEVKRTREYSWVKYKMMMVMTLTSLLWSVIFIFVYVLHRRDIFTITFV